MRTYYVTSLRPSPGEETRSALRSVCKLIQPDYQVKTQNYNGIPSIVIDAHPACTPLWGFCGMLK